MLDQIAVTLGKSCFVSLCVALAIWIIDGIHIGFGWYIVLQLLVAFFMLIIQFVNVEEVVKKPLKKL